MRKREEDKNRNKEQGQQIENSNKYGRYLTILIITLTVNDLMKKQFVRINKKILCNYMLSARNSL